MLSVTGVYLWWKKRWARHVQRQVAHSDSLEAALTRAH